MRHARAIVCLLAVTLVVSSTGCVGGPSFVAAPQRKPIDRSLVDYPGGVVLEEVVHGLTGPIDCEVDPQGNLIVVESGADGYDPRIIGYKPSGEVFNIYPPIRLVRFPFDIIKPGFWMYGPVGGLSIADGKIYVSHRDATGSGVVTAFGYDGSHSTVVGSLPCQGDHGMSDIAINPASGRLWFGVGSATNSGVVGLDNWDWVKKHPEFCDRSFVDLKLLGFHFKSKHPDAGLFGAPETAVTAPFRPFNAATQTRIRHNDTPTAAVYSVNPTGGGLQVEAHGIRRAVGLSFSEFGTLYMTNQGMELRGTRPIKDDPDTLLKFNRGWYGFPDYSADLDPITDSRFQLRGDMLKLLTKSGYDEISFLIDHSASNDGEGLIPPARSTLLQATFPSLSGAARFDFIPPGGPLGEFRGNALVPLGGDHAPFATSGRKLQDPVGFKIVRVDLATREVFDFIRNARTGPASKITEGKGLLERPVAVKFAPDGSLYIVDFGRVEYAEKDGREKVRPMTGKVFRLRPMPPASTQPAK